LKFFLNNGDEHVGGHGAPNLRLDRVLVVAQKLLDTKVLFDPFEEQFHLPTAFVQSSNGQVRQGGVVGQEEQILLGCWVLEPDSVQVFGVVLGNVVPVQCDGFIADKAAAPVHLVRLNAPGVHVAFGAGHKEGAGLMHLEQASKVYVASVYDVERPRLQDQDVQNIDLVHLAIADVDEGRNRASEVQQGVQLDGCLGFAKRRPVEQAQTENDGGGIQCVGRVLEIEPQVLVQIKLASAPDQSCSQVGPDSPVARLVGIVPVRAVNAVAKSHGMQLARVGSQGHFDVAHTLSPSQLSKSHDAKLLRASQEPHTRVAAIASHDARKACPWNELHDLREQGLADIYRKSPRGLNLGSYTKMKKRVSNRHQIKLTARPRHYWDSLRNNPV
jgi:hypothetical protein